MLCKNLPLIGYLSFILIIFTVWGCNSSSDYATAEGELHTSIHHDFRLVTVVDSLLQHPWSLAFLPNGDMLVTERGSARADGNAGQLRIIRNGELLPDPVPGLP